MTTEKLQEVVEQLFAAGSAAASAASAMDAFLELREALERGEVRAASPDPTTAIGWRVNAWVKQGILLGFRIGALQDFSSGGFSFVDKHTYPVLNFHTRGRHPSGSRRLVGAFGRLSRARCRLHAADVCQFRRLGG